MKKLLQITATFDKPDLLENMVEKLACRRIEYGYSNMPVPKESKAIDTSSAETYVSGTIALEDNKEIINMPFITCFLFTCIKGKNGVYKLEWGSSLS